MEQSLFILVSRSGIYSRWGSQKDVVWGGNKSNSHVTELSFLETKSRVEDPSWVLGMLNPSGGQYFFSVITIECQGSALIALHFLVLEI